MQWLATSLPFVFYLFSSIDSIKVDNRTHRKVLVRLCSMTEPIAYQSLTFIFMVEMELIMKTFSEITKIIDINYLFVCCLFVCSFSIVYFFAWVLFFVTRRTELSIYFAIQIAFLVDARHKYIVSCQWPKARILIKLSWRITRSRSSRLRGFLPSHTSPLDFYWSVLVSLIVSSSFSRGPVRRILEYGLACGEVLL